MTGPIERDGLTLKVDYFGDPAAYRALADLISDTFGLDISSVDRLGGADPTSMPFGWFDGNGRCVANFSAFSMPLMVDGRSVRAVGYQSGAVRPDYRGRGLYRDVIQRAFAWSESQGYASGLLLTETPGLYEPYGFRCIPQHSFILPVPARTSGTPARPLSIDTPADIALIRALLDARVPVSERFAVAGHAIEFMLNACFNPDVRLSHLPDCDAVVAWAEADGRFRLLDIVGRLIPSLSAVVAAIGVEAQEAEVMFPPDRLALQHVPARGQRIDYLMARGELLGQLQDRHIMLSPMADF
jgi:predicted N-acetyltransferase YhbS